jgi:hypothetical protein
MKRMFGFLHALHEGLVELYLNGRNPLPLPDIIFVRPPNPKPQRQYHPGEKAFREAQDARLDRAAACRDLGAHRLDAPICVR